MTPWDRWLHRAANVAIVLVAAATLVVAIQHVRLGGRSAASEARTPPGPSPGQALAVNGIDWSASRATVVLALAPQCQFCKESSSFYQQLGREIGQHPGVRMIAMFGAPEAEARAYVERERIAVSQVVSVSMEGAGVMATPTLLLVDTTGRIRQLWIGKLTPDQERDVLSSLAASS